MLRRVRCACDWRRWECKVHVNVWTHVYSIINWWVSKSPVIKIVSRDSWVMISAWAEKTREIDAHIDETFPKFMRRHHSRCSFVFECSRPQRSVVILHSQHSKCPILVLIAIVIYYYRVQVWVRAVFFFFFFRDIVDVHTKVVFILDLQPFFHLESNAKRGRSWWPYKHQ